MKKKRIFSLILAFVMIMAMAVTAGAANIDITNAVEGQTYNAYKIFDVTKSGTSYAYKIDSGSKWFSTVQTFATAKNGMTLSKVGSSTVYNVTVTDAFNEAKAAELAVALNDALKAMQEKPAADSTVKAEGTTVKMTGLTAGYYFVDSSLGALCVLNTAADSVEIHEKNSIPTLTKYVQEGTSWGETADAFYGQSVEFKLTVNTGSNDYADGTGVDADYVITDVIPTHMTLDGTDGAYITINGWTKDTNYTEVYDSESRTLTITLKQDKLATLGENANIEIRYSATLNNTATAGEAETNTATLTYNGTTSQDTATVKTWDIDVFKFAKGEGTTKNPLANATFKLTTDGTNAIKLTKVDGENTYKYDTAGTVTEITTDDTGRFTITGLDSGTYKLVETAAPAGYNLLTAPVTIVVGNDGKITIGDIQVNEVEVENKTGQELPSTGGIGTIIFYTLGAMLAVGAGVILVTKKRVSNKEN